MPSKSHPRSKPVNNVQADAASQIVLDQNAAVQLTEAAKASLCFRVRSPPRPPAASAQAHPGVHPLTTLTAAQPFEPLPSRWPTALSLRTRSGNSRNHRSGYGSRQPGCSSI